MQELEYGPDTVAATESRGDAQALAEAYQSDRDRLAAENDALNAKIAQLEATVATLTAAARDAVHTPVQEVRAKLRRSDVIDWATPVSALQISPDVAPPTTASKSVSSLDAFSGTALAEIRDLKRALNEEKKVRHRAFTSCVPSLTQCCACVLLVAAVGGRSEEHQ